MTKRLFRSAIQFSTYSLLLLFPLAAGVAKGNSQHSVSTINALSFSGNWVGEKGEQLTRSQLAELDCYRTIHSEIVPRAGMAELGVVPLAELIDFLELGEEADGVVLECTDSWESFMEVSYIRENNPLLLVYYNGEGPELGNWPWFGGNIEPLEPFYVFIEGRLDSYPESPAYGMISATQLSGLRAVNTTERYEPFFSEPMDQLSVIGQEGRRLFLQRCNTCHQGPGMVGGNVSQRPFIILQTHARYNAPYFRSTVINPKSDYPNTIMPKHEDFTDADLDALIAFLSESAALSE